MCVFMEYLFIVVEEFNLGGICNNPFFHRILIVWY